MIVVCVLLSVRLPQHGGSNATWCQKFPTSLRKVASRCTSSLWISLQRGTTTPACLVTSQDQVPLECWPSNRHQTSTSRLNERCEEAQVRTLFYTMARQARTIVQTFDLPEGDAKKYEIVKHFVAARNVVHESACFHRVSKNPGDSIHNFVTALQTLADRCDCGTFNERMVRHRFVIGLMDAKLSETLQMDAELTLASAAAEARLK